MDFAGHSFRIGAATTAAGCGIEDFLMGVGTVMPSSSISECHKKTWLSSPEFWQTLSVLFW